MSETLKIKCLVTEDNDQGFYVIDAENLTNEMEIFGGKGPDATDMTVAELKAALAEAGVEAPDHAKKADLVALYQSLPE